MEDKKYQDGSQEKTQELRRKSSRTYYNGCKSLNRPDIGTVTDKGKVSAAIRNLKEAGGNV